MRKYVTPLICFAMVVELGSQQKATTESLAGLPAKLLPADEGPRDPSFASFRRDLLTSIEAGKVNAVLAAVDPNVVVHQLETKTGINELRRTWNIEKAPDDFLKELQDVLRLGGRFRDGAREFIAPYVTADFPSTGSYLPSEFAVVVEKDAPVYRHPRKTAPVLVRLTYDIVDYTPVGAPWVEVRLRDGRAGYMSESTVRSPADTHAVFSKKSGHWRLVEFAQIAD